MTSKPPLPSRLKQKKSEPVPNGELGISLNEAHRRLEIALKERAPARITLHRHSSSGALKHLVVREAGSRQYYDPMRIIAYYRSGMGRSAPAPARPGKTLASTKEPGNLNGAGQQVHLTADPEASKFITEAVLSEVLPTIRATQAQAAQEMANHVAAQITAALEPLQGLLKGVHDQLADLSRTRQTLMLKYDSEANLTAQRLATAEAEVKRLRTGDNEVLTMSRLQADVSRMHDTLKNLHTLVGEIASKGVSQ